MFVLQLLPMPAWLPCPERHPYAHHAGHSDATPPARSVASHAGKLLGCAIGLFCAAIA